MNEQVQAHKEKDEDVRRVREAEPPRVEEVTSDMDVEGGGISEEEVGVNFETGKRRKEGCIFQGRTFSSLDISDSV